MNRIDVLSRLILVVTDYLLILGAFVLAYFIRVGWILSTDFPFSPYFKISALVSLAWIFFFVLFRVYALHHRTDTKGHFLRIFLANVAGIASFVILFFTLRKLFFSRLIPIYTFIIATFSLILAHWLAQKIRGKLTKKGKGVSRVLIIGANRATKELIKNLQEANSKHLPVAILDAYGSSLEEINNIPIAGKLNVLEKTIEKYKVDEIIQTDNLEQTLNIINFCQQKNLAYAMLPSLLGVFHNDIEVQTLEIQPVVRLKKPQVNLWEILLGK